MAFNCNFCHTGTKLSATTDSLFQDDVIAASAAASSDVTSPQQITVDHSADIASPNTSPGSSRRRRQWNNLVSRAFARLWPALHTTDTPTQSATSPLRSSQLHQRPQLMHQHQQQQQQNHSKKLADAGEVDVLSRRKMSTVSNGRTDLDNVVGSAISDELSKNDLLGKPPGVVNSEQLNSNTTVAVDKIQPPTGEYAHYTVDILLKEGRDLVIKDSCGTSDPYVKFKVGGKQLYKSRTICKCLNPSWYERFSIPLNDLSRPIKVKVYDYDRGLTDDAMGDALIEPSRDLQMNESVTLKLVLADQKASKDLYMGYLLLDCVLLCHTQGERNLSVARRVAHFGSESKKASIKTQQWASVVTIALIEGHDLVAMDDNGLSDPYVKFKLGAERYKTKCKLKTLNPRWLEQFDLYVFDDKHQHLEIAVFDHDKGGRDEVMGRAIIDLASLQAEKTHELHVTLEDNAGTLLILLTISGLHCDVTNNQLATESNDAIANYSLLKSFSNIDDVGTLTVKVLRAKDLSAADIGGKSDPYCVLELVNSRLQTHTIYKTLAPEWNKQFTLHVRDIHAVLEVTVNDEDRNKKVEFLGKVVIPLLNVVNGERKWYALKDHQLCQPTKGSIELELCLIYNPLKAAIVTVNPRETKYMQPEPKFKVATMKHNVSRVQNILEDLLSCGNFVQSCFDWESKPRSVCAFAVFVCIVWNFELYMLPLTLIIIFIKNLGVMFFLGEGLPKDKLYDNFIDDDDDDDDKKEDKADRGQSLRERFQSVQEVCLQVQETMDLVACLCERLKNAFTWTVPWLAILAIIVLVIVATVLYVVPFRMLLLVWGINKFTKKLRAPNNIDNNEILDYLSRVPSDKELVMYRELRLETSMATPSKATPSKKKTTSRITRS